MAAAPDYSLLDSAGATGLFFPRPDDSEAVSPAVDLAIPVEGGIRLGAGCICSIRASHFVLQE
jgi:hypothetical protein